MADRGRMTARVDALVGRVARGILPRTPDFGSLLTEQARLVVETVSALVDFLESADPVSAARVSSLEKSGDRIRESNVRTLRRAFSTQFDRDLTSAAIQRIDDVANYAKTTVREMEVLDLAPDDAMREMAGDLLAGARELERAASALANDPASTEAHVHIVHKHERRIEKRYRAALAELFPADPEEILGESPDDRLAHAFRHLLDAMRRREVYRHLSNAADRLDDAGRALREIAIATV